MREVATYWGEDGKASDQLKPVLITREVRNFLSIEHPKKVKGMPFLGLCFLICPALRGSEVELYVP